MTCASLPPELNVALERLRRRENRATIARRPAPAVGARPCSEVSSGGMTRPKPSGPAPESEYDPDSDRPATPEARGSGQRGMARAVAKPKGRRHEGIRDGVIER